MNHDVHILQKRINIDFNQYWINLLPFA